MSAFTAAFISEEGFAKCFNDSTEDLRFSGEEAAFIKALASYFTDFSSKVLKLVSKQESSRLKSYPTGTFNDVVWSMVNSMKKTAAVMSAFGTSLDDVILILNNTTKTRQTERQKIYGEATMYLSTVKTSKAELDKKLKEYNSKAKSTDDAINSLAKLKANTKSKSRDISKAESKEDKALNALSVATECYEYQIQLTNETTFEAYNTNLPEQLKKFENFKMAGIKHYAMVSKQVCELFKKIPKTLDKVADEYNSSVSNFCAEESIQKYISKSGSEVSLPSPFTFQPYQPTSDNFPVHDPKYVKPFEFSIDYSSIKVVETAPRESIIKKSKKRKIGKKKSWRPGSSRKSVDTSSGVPVEEELKPKKSTLSNTLNVPSSKNDSCSDDDGDDDDGIPIEEDDGIPIEEEDGIPIEEEDGVPIEESRNAPSIVMEKPSISLKKQEEPVNNTFGVNLQKTEPKSNISLDKPAEPVNNTFGVNLKKTEPKSNIALDKPAEPVNNTFGGNLQKSIPQPTNKFIGGTRANTLTTPKEQKNTPSVQGVFGTGEAKTNSMGAADFFMAQQMMMQNPQYREQMALQFAQNPELYKQYQLQMFQYQQAMQQQYANSLQGNVAGNPLVNQPTLNTPGTNPSDDATIKLSPSRPKKRSKSRKVDKNKLAAQLSSEQVHDGTIRAPSRNDVNDIVNQLGMTTLSMTAEQKEKLREEFGNPDFDLSGL